jgi:exodeoxyribonuclease-3
MKIATWNVNSLKVRLPHLLTWLAEDAPAVVALQETKLEDKRFPAHELAEAGYASVFHGQKTYNGVALLVRSSTLAGGCGMADEAHEVVRGHPHFLDDPQARVLAATLPADSGAIRVISAYFPNGESLTSDKFAYKLKWLAALESWLSEELARHPRLILCGDFNIAPEDRDTHDPAQWAGGILCSEAERRTFADMLALGMVDAFRLFPQPERSFSWWDYRQLGFQRNHGLRIDHVLISRSLVAYARSAGIRRELRGWERPSDHAPVWVELAI